MLFAAICLGTLLVVVESSWLRHAALADMLLGFASSFVHFLWLRQPPLAVAFHLAIATCLALVATAILRDILGREAITGDQIVGAVCGYLLAAIAWG